MIHFFLHKIIASMPTEEEQTLVFVKPDGVKRGLVGKIINQFEEKGLKLQKLEMRTMTSELADKHYEEHVNKSFYPSLKEFIMSGPVVALVLQGLNAVKAVRSVVGKTDSSIADPGSIRGKYSLSKSENIVHASDSTESAKREISNFFN